MREKVARELRRFAYNKWSTMSKEYRKAVPLRFVYKQVKKEFYNEKR